MDDRDYMARAIRLSQLGLGRTFPNPIVGALLVSEAGEILGEGFHAGGAHAEIEALTDSASRSNDTRGATMYVTLEPCNHHGRTPPCTLALIEAGIARVVFAMKDPNPIAQGGESHLAAAGIKVISNLLEDAARESNRSWLRKIETGRPFLIWKIASTIDGYSAAVDGSSQWITSEESRKAVQELRAESDAIVVGTGTALLDNPTLIPRGDRRRPMRIVVGTRSIPDNFNLLDGEARTIFLKTRDLDALISSLTELQVNQVLIESGPGLGTALLKARLIDEIHWYQAPTVLGGGRKVIGEMGLATLSERLDFTIIEVKRSGSDTFTLLRPLLQQKDRELGVTP